MLFLDDLLLSPITGFKFILRTLARIAEEEYTDDGPAKERLLELQTLLEEGSITEVEYVERERDVMAELREIRERRSELAGEPSEAGGPVDRPIIEMSVSLPPAKSRKPKTREPRMREPKTRKAQH